MDDYKNYAVKLAYEYATERWQADGTDIIYDDDLSVYDSGNNDKGNTAVVDMRYHS